MCSVFVRVMVLRAVVSNHSFSKFSMALTAKSRWISASCADFMNHPQTSMSVRLTKQPREHGRLADLLPVRHPAHRSSRVGWNDLLDDQVVEEHPDGRQLLVHALRCPGQPLD